MICRQSHQIFPISFPWSMTLSHPQILFGGWTNCILQVAALHGRKDESPWNRVMGRKEHLTPLIKQKHSCFAMESNIFNELVIMSDDLCFCWIKSYSIWWRNIQWWLSWRSIRYSATWNSWNITRSEDDVRSVFWAVRGQRHPAAC